MSYNKYCTVAFGSSKSGLLTVGYQLFNADGTANGGRQVSSIQDLAGGTYGFLVVIPDNFIGRITWDTGGSPIFVASEEINTNIRLDMGQTVPLRDLTAVTTQNIGDCLTAARSDGVGAMELNLSTKTQILKGPNSETIRTFVVDDVDRPTRRD
jgi:hypothetical protein